MLEIRRPSIFRASGHSIALAFISIAGAFLRFLHLGRLIFYWDEPLHTVRIAAQPLPFVLAQNDASAFFSLLVHLLLPLGKPEVTARLASAAFGVGSIVAVYFLGKELFSKKEGLLASLFVALSPLLIRYSQYSRAYSVYIFLCTVSLYFLIKSIRTNRNRFWIFYSAAMILNIYNHLFSGFLLPAFGVYAGGTALIGWIKGKSKREKNRGVRIFLKFLLCTFCILVLVALLYLPDKGVQKFLSVSLSRAVEDLPDESPAAFPADDILKNLLTPFNSTSFILFLFFAAVGLVDLSKKEGLLSITALFYMALPYVFFLVIKPTPAHVLSLWRYMAYILPLFLLLTGKGIFTAASLLSLLLTKWRAFAGKKDLLAKLAAGLIAAFFLLKGFAHKSYYLDFQRLNSLKMPPEITDFLSRNLRKDAFFYFDTFPASNLIMVVNPLTKDLKLEEIEMAVRENFQSEGEAPQILVYRVRQLILEWYINRRVDLWAVTKKNPEKLRHYTELSCDDPSLRVYSVKDFTFLHFTDPSVFLWQKLARMTEILLQADPESKSKTDLFLIAARSLLLGGDFDPAVRNLERNRMSSMDFHQEKAGSASFCFRLLDSLFGLDQRAVRTIAQKKFLYSDIAKLLIRQGDRFRRERMFEKAFLAYVECAKLSPEFHLTVSRRLTAMADACLSKGMWQEAVSFVEKSLEFDPARTDAGSLLSELYRRSGLHADSMDVFRRFFLDEPLSPADLDRLMNTDPLFIVLRKDSIVYFLFRSEKRAFFSGRLTSSGKIRKVETGRISQRDSVRFLGNRLDFQIGLNTEGVKVLAVKTSKKSAFSIDVKVTGRRDSSKILLLDSRSSLSHPNFR